MVRRRAQWLVSGVGPQFKAYLPHLGRPGNTDRVGATDSCPSGHSAGVRASVCRVCGRPPLTVRGAQTRLCCRGGAGAWRERVTLRSGPAEDEEIMATGRRPRAWRGVSAQEESGNSGSRSDLGFLCAL